MAHSERAHARLSPSSAKRWLMCPGSVKLSEAFPDTTSSYAEEGTAAHELAEKCLRNKQDAASYASMLGVEVDEEMATGAQLYVDWVLSQCEIGDELEIESRLDLTHVSDEMFGTGDALIYKVKDRHLIVADFKYGRGVPVEPKENAQGLTYAVGAIRRYHNRPLDKVSVAIIQPRALHRDGPIRVWETDPISVLDFEYDLRVGAAEVAAATDEIAGFISPPEFWETKYLSAGEWCRFCKALPTCPAARQKAIDAARDEFMPEQPLQQSALTPDRLGELLNEAEFQKMRWKAIEEFAHQEALAGRSPTGWKLAAKRAMRKWKIGDEEVAASLILAFDLLPGQIFDKKLRSPAQVEKLLPKDKRADMDAFVTKESSGLVLVAESDPRQPAKPDAAEEFG